MTFKGRTLKPIQSEYVGLNDIVSINGIIGWLDFIGKDIVAVIDEKEMIHKIAIKDIHSVVKFTDFIKGNLANVPIQSLIKAA